MSVFFSLLITSFNTFLISGSKVFQNSNLSLSPRTLLLTLSVCNFLSFISSFSSDLDISILFNCKYI